MNDFERQMQHVLRRSEHDIDDDTARRLAEARGVALSANKQRIPRFFVPATGMALASVLALVLVLSPEAPTSGEKSAASREEALLSEPVDLYEDMDFYYWLAREENNLQG